MFTHHYSSIEKNYFIDLITMRDLKTLKELVASITDAESLEKLSSKSFKPSLLDYAISQHAPHFYSEQELIQLHVFFKQLSSSFHQRENTDNTPTIIRKRYIALYFISFVNLVSLVYFYE